MNEPFLTFRELNDTGVLCYYILQKAQPHYVGIVSVGILPESLASAPIGGYNLYVNFSSCLHGNYIPNFKDVIMDINSVLWSMGNWFLNNRVLTDQKKYSKFKLNYHADLSTEQTNS